MIHLLHISDYHARGPNEKQPYLRERVLGQAWKRNLETLREEGEINYILFSGDGAQSGKPEEYAELTDFLGRTCEDLNLTLAEVYPVPGNHDIDRTRQISVWTHLREQRKSIAPERFSEWMAGLRDLKEFDNAWRDEILERQQAYRAWVAKDLGKPDLYASSPHGLGYRTELKHRDMSLHLIGLDSAWLCGDESDNGNIALTRDQVYKLCTDERGKPLSGFRLAMMHHPLEELADGETPRFCAC